MNMTKLSVSSVILAAVLSGCSQQQVIGGSQVVNGSGPSQMAGGSQSQIEGGSQVAGASQSQIGGASQRQVEPGIPVVSAPTPIYKAPVKRAPVRVFHKPIQKQVSHVAPKPKMTRSISRGNGLPAAKPGQCFAKVKEAPKFVTKSKRVLIQAATSKRVLVRAPQYRTISKKVLVRKAQYTNSTVPAVYRNQTTKVLVRPAYNTWKKGHGAITRIDNSTGQIMCRVTVPAEYKNVTKRVQVRAAQNVRKFIPAVYRTVQEKQRVSEALYKTVNHPARYQTKNYKVQVAGARYTWRPVLCATNAPKNYKHQTKAKVQNPVKRIPKEGYKRPATNNLGISYDQYLAVMNAPIQTKKQPKKKNTVKKIVVKKAMAPEVITKVAPKVIPKKDVAPKVKPKQEMPKQEATKQEIPKQEVAPKKVEAKAMAPKPVVATPEKAENKADIQQNIVYGIQAALKSKGYNPGKLDGKMGANTAAALKAFQSSRGLPVGVLSKDTFRALGLVK